MRTDKLIFISLSLASLTALQVLACSPEVEAGLTRDGKIEEEDEEEEGEEEASPQQKGRATDATNEPAECDAKNTAAAGAKARTARTQEQAGKPVSECEPGRGLED